MIQGREALNRAVDGDIVAIEILPESKWCAQSGVVLQDDDEDLGDVLEDEKQMEELMARAQGSEKQPTGIVVGIIRRKWRQYCGILLQNTIKGTTRHIFVPAEKKIPRVRIETRQAETLKGQRIIVAIDSWPRFSR